MKYNNYQVTKVYKEDNAGEYKVQYSLHPGNRLPLGNYQVANLEINHEKLTNSSIDKLIEFLQGLKVKRNS